MIARAALALAAVLLAATVPEPPDFRMDDYRAPVPRTLAGARVVSVTEVRDLVGDPSATLIDVLPAPRRPPSMRPGMPWLPEPHRSIPGALWWPDVGRGALAPSLESRFRERLEAAAGPGRQRLLVFFCLSDCWMSWNAGKRAVAWGYRVAWFPFGVDGWSAAGLPTQIVEPTALD